MAPFYFDWLRHPAEDPWWNWSELRNKYDRTHAAVLNLSAWYDDNYGPEGATTNYAGLLKARAGDKDPRTHLLLGPWVHGVDNTAKTKSGEREFGPAAAIDYDECCVELDGSLSQRASRMVSSDEKPVRYFVMGANQWRESDVWPPPGSDELNSFLRLRQAGERAGSLSAKPAGGAESFSEFVSDPDQSCGERIRSFRCA